MSLFIFFYRLGVRLIFITSLKQTRVSNNSIRFCVISYKDRIFKFVCFHPDITHEFFQLELPLSLITFINLFSQSRCFSNIVYKVISHSCFFPILKSQFIYYICLSSVIVLVVTSLTKPKL